MSLSSSASSISSATPRSGRSIREFSLVEPLGTGGYGTVWLAKRKRTGDLVAIKVHSKSHTKTKNMLSGVFLERKILLEADNPYVTKLFFAFATSKHMYMVMEYLPGGDCYYLLQTYGFLDEPVARWFVAEALLGLEYLHSLGIVHRDIKPHNIVLSETSIESETLISLFP